MMTEREFQEMLHQLTQPIPQETHRAFLRAACGKDERIVKRKLSTSLILALVLIFLTTALAFAMTNGFGILDYNATQKDNNAYVGHIWVFMNPTKTTTYPCRSTKRCLTASAFP